MISTSQWGSQLTGSTAEQASEGPGLGADLDPGPPRGSVHLAGLLGSLGAQPGGGSWGGVAAGSKDWEVERWGSTSPGKGPGLRSGGVGSENKGGLWI